MSSKQIVCLANSRKHNFRCVAGKEFNDHGTAGVWIRPVSAPPERGINVVDCTYNDGNIAAVLDVIKIPLLNADNHLYQSENSVIDPEFYWTKMGGIAKNNLGPMVDNPSTLWETGYSSYSGANDRVPLGLLTGYRPTLYLIQPENIQFRVKAEGAAFGDQRKKVRVFFDYKNIHYGLSVTDFHIEAQYLAMNEGIYPANDVSYFTVSMTELYKGEYAYKVVAAVF